MFPRLIALAFALFPGLAPAALTVATDFEGGSARGVTIDESTRTIRFMPGGDPARGWPCWWYLRADGATVGEELTFALTASDQIITQKGGYEGKPLSADWSTPVRAAVSFDGKTWTQTAPGEKQPNGRTWRVKAEASTFWLAWGPPFTPKDALELTRTLAAQVPGVEAYTLTKSREGRDVPALRIHVGPRPTHERFGVWAEARCHAWESGGSWVGRGFAEWIATSPDDAARWLRENAEVFVVPIMDFDHVATGDGGKEALPQDHNRDWSDTPHWPEIAAAQARVTQLVKEGRLDVFLDLHNPGAANLATYFYTGEDSILTEAGLQNRTRFMDLARTHLTGPIPYDAKAAQASGIKYHPLWRQMSTNWATLHALPHTVALCLETAWNTPFSTSDGYRTTGAQLAAAVAHYLQANPRPAK